MKNCPSPPASYIKICDKSFREDREVYKVCRNHVDLSSFDAGHISATEREMAILNSIAGFLFAITLGFLLICVLFLAISW